jgi:hypothetical protein
MSKGVLVAVSELAWVPAAAAVSPAVNEGDAWADAPLPRLAKHCGQRMPPLWKPSLDARQAPALQPWLREGRVHVMELLRDPENRDELLSTVPLLQGRGGVGARAEGVGEAVCEARVLDGLRAQERKPMAEASSISVQTRESGMPAVWTPDALERNIEFCDGRYSGFAQYRSRRLDTVSDEARDYRHFELRHGSECCKKQPGEFTEIGDAGKDIDERHLDAGSLCDPRKDVYQPRRIAAQPARADVEKVVRTKSGCAQLIDQHH